MTVIAWDGEILAADSLAVSCGLKLSTSKILEFYDAIGDRIFLAFSGQVDHGLALIDWYMNGQVKKDYPEFQKTNDWTRLIVVNSTKNDVFVFEQTPFPIIQNKHFAWGSGRDYALGAMAMGADARKAVEIACAFSASCGLPVESHDLRIVK
jgi:ATP-dependent protease HslVU (ClpYQ) peptidase subunit